MKPYAIVDGVEFYETYYKRKGQVRIYRAKGTITLCGKRYPTHRAIGYAKATDYQRARFSAYDCHHVNGNHADNTWSNIQPLTAYRHRSL